MQTVLLLVTLLLAGAAVMISLQLWWLSGRQWTCLLLGATAGLLAASAGWALVRQPDEDGWWRAAASACVCAAALSMRPLVRQLRDADQRQQQLLAAQSQLRAIMDNTTAVVYIKDREFRYQLINRRFERLFDVTLEEVVGKEDFDIFPEEMARRFREVDARVVQHREIVEEEEQAPHADGPHTYISVKVPLVDEADAVYAVAGISTDITDRKRAEEQFRQVADQLRHTAEELQRSNRDLQQFAAIVAHDLQEPMRGVAGFCGLLEKQFGDRWSEQEAEYFGFIKRSSQRMQALVRDLLEVSRVESAELRFEPVELSEVLDVVLRHWQLAIAESQAEVTHGELPRVRGDRSLLTQLLQNLVGNAIKFRREEPPRIHVSAAPVEGAWQISVTDNGIGIDPRHQQRIFNIFERLHGSDEFPGTGIGLAICQRIAHRHGGRLWVESAPDQGSTFHVTLAAPDRGDQAAT